MVRDRWFFDFGDRRCGFNKTTARLDDGSIVDYDLAQSEESYLSDGPAYDSDAFEFIGFGICVAINDKPAVSNVRYALFKRK